MKKGFYLLIFVMAVTLMVSCGRNEVKQSLQQMEKIVEKAEKEKDKLSKEEWKTLAEQFEAQEKKLNEASEANKIGMLDQVKRLGLTTRWAAASGPSTLNDMFEKMGEELKADDGSSLKGLNEMLGSIKDAITSEETNGSEETNESEDVTENDRWVVFYKNVKLENRENGENGSFLKPRTGESVRLEEVKGQEESLALLMYADTRATFFTFPADAANAGEFTKFENSRLYQQESVGLKFWPQEKKVGGLAQKAQKLDVVWFNEVAKSGDPNAFDAAFKEENNGKEKIGNGSAYVISFKPGDVFLLQFNGTVRAILLVKTVVSEQLGTFIFDLLVEGREEFTDIDLAQALQPDKPVKK